eukprot:10897608-Alexandrium_andersonii.AAC.1
MSASLVGSEMCIRDRGWHADGEAPDRRIANDCRRFSKLKLPLGTFRNSCLLYTSDAADDM